ncbi:BTB/POZ domain-containing protein At1g01640-like [Durio zibethinus]|uniref:BTB/POZ domain-containing protein At1g01640-like n=1 Tax=Durio zibethinus TaxID=66656 RepID=A0A6P5YUT4_DURZI|nr:BTB/POZ domain-containing protein At1g01640-like [Durio zibethinus]
MSSLFGSGPSSSSFGFAFSSSPANSSGFARFASSSGGFSSTSPFTANLGNSTGFAPFASSSGGFSSTGNPASTISTSSGTTAQTSPSGRKNSSVTTPVNENTEDDLQKRIRFLSGLVKAFKEQTHTDIQLKPSYGPCILAHKALLAARSEIFKNMLDSVGCKAPSSDTDMITLSELNTEELESLLEFLYTGNLPLDKLEKHVFKLYAAADKYEIPYLQESCEHYMLNSLTTWNAVDVLEISDAHSSETLKEGTLNFIVRNMKGVVSSLKYEDFASSNPHLCVQMTRAFVDAKSH